MTAKETLKARHEYSKHSLKKASEKVIEKYGLNATAWVIAQIVGVSAQTVINYVSGRTKDGFLTEAIAKEYRNYNRKK